MPFNPNVPQNVLDMRKLETDLVQFFSIELPSIAKEEEWSDSQWTNSIHDRLARIGHSYGLRVYATKRRCKLADDSEWLYDHHWRIATEDGALVRIPLVMEIEWGSWNAGIKGVEDDFLKLVQARADLRVMVFQGGDIDSFTDTLIAMVNKFEGTERGDRWLFAHWGGEAKGMHCRLWSA